MARNWKRLRATSLLDGLRLVKDHAREKKNLSIERIAELMAVSPDSLYKWLGTGRMPLGLLPAYEHICGAHYASRYLALAGGGLVIDMPTGRAITQNDTQELQALLNTAVGAVLAFASGKADAPAALADIESGMSALAWHHATIAKSAQPELEFEA